MTRHTLTLEPGCALVIAGPQGSGKHLAATNLAKRYGMFSVLALADFGDKQFREYILNLRPRTLIVEGWPSERHNQVALKAIISSEKLRLRRDATEVPSPGVVILVDDVAIADRLQREQPRRMRVVKLGGQS